MRRIGLLKLGSPDWSRPKGPDLEDIEGRQVSRPVTKQERRGLLAGTPLLRGIPVESASLPTPKVVMPGNTGV